MYTLGLIGCGHMGGALVRASAKTLQSGIAVANRTASKAEQLAAATGAEVRDNRGIAANSRFILLGVKPQIMSEVLTDLEPVLRQRQDRFVLVSMAAGLKMEEICRMAGGTYPVIRIMPNTPVGIEKGMILYCANELVTEEEIRKFLDILSATGRLDALPEPLMDAGSAVSGCGPAFVYEFIEALSDGGVECGLPREKALEYAAQTVAGAAEMVLSTGSHPGELKDAVCSPSGSTIAGVHALESGAFRGTVMEAVCAAWKRTRELGKK